MQVASVSVSLQVLLGSDCYLQRPSTDCDVELIILQRVWVPSFTEEWDWNIGQPSANIMEGRLWMQLKVVDLGPSPEELLLYVLTSNSHLPL